MPVRNQNWYNLQSTRRYPLDDKTTGEDDSGLPIRDDIIVDCHIRYPSTLGKYLFIQGINVTPSLITVIIGAADSLTDTDCPTVAAVTVEKPAARYVNEPLTSFVAGLSGWITFGPGIETNFVGRYSTPMQTFLGLRNARPYTPLPVPSLGKDTVAEFLQGVVNIVAESPITATYHAAYTLPKYDPLTDETNALPVQAIVFSTEAPSAQFNPQTFFLAPCSQRPESGTCDKTPLERINGVEPDCETGNINIVFGGGLAGLPFEECGGIDILTDLGLTLACNRVPDSEKKRKDDCPCESDNNDGTEYCWPEVPDPEFDTCVDEPAPTCAELPLCVSFYSCVDCEGGEPVTPDGFITTAGFFKNATIEAPPICCDGENPGTTLTPHSVWLSGNNAGLNLGLYRNCAGDWAFGRRISAELRISTGGLKQNGGVVFNHISVTEGGRCRTKYFAAIVDAAASELQLYRFDGTLLIKENAIPISHIIGHWYRISVSVTGANGSASVEIMLHDITAGDQQVALLGVVVSDYEVVNGRAGVIANASATYFNKFEIV